MHLGQLIESAEGAEQGSQLCFTQVTCWSNVMSATQASLLGQKKCMVFNQCEEYTVDLISGLKNFQGPRLTNISFLLTMSSTKVNTNQEVRL